MSDLLLTSPFLSLFRRAAASGGVAVLWLSLLLVFLLPPQQAKAQIVDDTTKTIYGPKTTFIIREADVLREKTEGRMVDTTLTDMQQARFWAHDSTYQQDLGELGTASRQLLWAPNTQLGARLGRNVFDRYVRNSATIPYYDTRSPYAFLRYVQGTPESVFELSFSRSIKKTASVGFAYERFSANKLYTANPREGLTDHSNVLLFMRYQTEDERYHVLANLNTSRHKSVEQGGIRPLATDTLGRGDLFGNEDRRTVWLTKAANNEDRDQVHVAQTYRLLGKGLTAFHVLDLSRQLNKYTDTQLPTSNGEVLYYPEARRSITATDDRVQYRQIENTVGVLGRTETVEYRIYGRHRKGSLDTQSLIGNPGVLTRVTQPDSAIQKVPGQLFVGGTAAFRYKIFAIETAGEYRFFKEYWVRAAAKLGPLTGEIFSSSYSPTLTQQQFIGNHYLWNNNFSQTQVNQLTVRVDQTLGHQRLQASGAVVNLTNLVYYDASARPAQLSDAKQLIIVSARHRAQFGSFFSDNEATYTLGGDGAGLHIPALVANGKVYYQGDVFKKALFGQVGAEVYYQSRFRAYGYSPSTQQFYVQDNFTIRNYPVVDVFLNADIKTVAIFLKMAYVNQGLYRNGYFASPYYTSLPRRFQLGLRWQFFN
ncbi:putative porin [Hymenobacter sp. BT491]|uniref:putative porin n=1 Tax=Hymenobacter sp. BT491 TaxID=2766779 RepID=UPI001653B2DD|nr:putative porin [Hymenobacter sp. BT491]MBC6989798.1 hypothetical protein [Hymenobacter sp. BT491]